MGKRDLEFSQWHLVHSGDVNGSKIAVNEEFFIKLFHFFETRVGLDLVINPFIDSIFEGKKLRRRDILCSESPFHDP
jgi:hypothetical protein